MARGIWLSASHACRVCGPVSTAREPLSAVDDPLVTLKKSRRLQLCRIRAAYIRFGHSEAGKEFSRHQTIQISLPPLIRGIHVQHQRILQRVSPKHEHSVITHPNNLVDVDPIEE